MKEIKTKEARRAPKLKDPVSRMPRELMRNAVLQAKEKSAGHYEGGTSGDHQESATEYSGRKVESAEAWAASRTARVFSTAGRSLAKKSYEKIRERTRGVPASKDAEERAEDQAKECIREKAVSGKPGMMERNESLKAEPMGTESRKAESVETRFGRTEPMQTGTVGSEPDIGRIKTKAGSNPASDSAGIKGKQNRRELLHSGSGRGVKTSPRTAGKPSGMPTKEIRAGQAAVRKKQAGYGAKAARQMAVRSARTSLEAAKSAEKTAKLTVRGILTAIKTAAAASKGLAAIASAGGGLAVLLILVVGVVGGVLLSGSSQSAEPVSQEVMNYAPVIQRYAREYGIPDYVQVIQAIMMQESRGQGTDPMQASECPFNTRYPNSPNGITDPEYSIQVGIRYYAYCIQEAGCTSPQELDKLKLSLQGYNYGNGYISWAIQNHGGYSEANALQFSQEQAAVHGWSGYGDPEYVPHVMRYYSGGNLFAGLFGNSQMVSTAMAQMGDEGGEKFWLWYGFSQREEWCACFVSWCADQCGLIGSGAVPKFASCPAGVEWFRSNGKWKENGYSPAAGTIIFFDWNGDGVSDHVGIVEKCENGRVYTVEGNSNDRVQKSIYIVEADLILGYGILD